MLYRKYKVRIVDTIVGILIHFSFCVMKFRVARPQTEFYSSCQHHIDHAWFRIRNLVSSASGKKKVSHHRHIKPNIIKTASFTNNSVCSWPNNTKKHHEIFKGIMLLITFKRHENYIYCRKYTAYE